MQPMEAGEIDVATIHGVDLNSIWHFSEGFRGGACEQWQDAFRPAHGLSAMEHVHADCLAVWRGLAGAEIVLRRAVSSDGCPVDLSGEPARHRDLPVSAGCQALRHG